MSKDKVYLVGPMGAGKSTIGRVLAGELGLPFHDTDRVIEERTGADIPWIFDVEGESGFRARESGVLAELAEHEPAVVAKIGRASCREREKNRVVGVTDDSRAR